MKHLVKKLSVAVAAFSCSFGAFAVEGEAVDTAEFSKYYTKSDNQSHSSSSEADSYVTLNKELTFEKDVSVDGDIKVKGDIVVQGSGVAVVNDKQSSTLNEIMNTEQSNDASVNENSLSQAQGRIGLNLTSGDNNQQDNATALSALTASSEMMYSADAEVFAYQDNEFNHTETTDSSNNSHILDGVLEGAAGEIGVNLASGQNHQQKNNLSLSQVFNGSLAEANVSAEQYSDHNHIMTTEGSNSADIGGNVLANAAGNIGINITAGIGNQQANHMALSSTTGTAAVVGASPTPTPVGGEG